MLIVCHSGKHQTGVMVACLRKAQGWVIPSIHDEYTRFGQLRPANQELIEEFDEFSIPMPVHPPSWLRS